MSGRPRFLRSGNAAGDILTRTKRDEEIVVRASVAEEMRLLAQRLELRDRGRAVLSVCGTVRGEGATYIATALAVTVAHDSAMSVCLVDCDWTTSPAEEDGPSLADVVRSGGDITDAAERTDLDRFQLIRSGEVGAIERAPLANSGELSAAIEELSDAFDVVILDTPPLVGEAYPSTIARLAPETVYVIRQGGVPVEQVRTSMADLGEGQIAGVVLNAARQRTPRWLVNPMVAS